MKIYEPFFAIKLDKFKLKISLIKPHKAKILTVNEVVSY